MTNKKSRKRRKLTGELLIYAVRSAGISLLLFLLLSNIAVVIAEQYCFYYDVLMTEFDWIELDRTIFLVSALIACICFSVLFHASVSDQIAYIRKITAGIDSLKSSSDETSIPPEGNNELTDLANSINNMSLARKQLRSDELALAEEKDQLIRTLSHDIRTPLTSILAYTDYLLDQDNVSPETQQSHLLLIRKKAHQIRELTDILLDGTKRNLTYFDDAKLLFMQLCMEFQSELEDQFIVNTDYSSCPAFSGSFDVRELERIFDNLISNVRKYADSSKPVELSLTVESNSLLICQRNAPLPDVSPSDGFRIGLNSIRRIAQLYHGQVVITHDNIGFSISIKMSL